MTTADIIAPQKELYVPPHVRMQAAPDDNDTDEKKGEYLPQPTGFYILCGVPEAKETFENSAIVKADSVMRTEEHTTTVLFVLRVGPLAYKDEKRFPDGKPWCKVGDFVLVRAYTGTRFKIFGKEFRLVADDQIEAVVSDPRGVTRA